MTEKIIQGAIDNLINESKKILIPNSITTLTANLNDASKNQDFYKIDYLKYAKQIIDNSNLSPERKEEIRKRFKNPPIQANKRCSDLIKDKVVFFSEPGEPTSRRYTPPPIKIQSSAPNLVNRNIANYNDLIANPPVYRKTKYCTACNNPIEEENLAYYKGYPFHNFCIKCMKCPDSVNDSRPKTADNYVSITKGLFLCHQHYDEYRGLKQLPTEINDIYHQKNKENFVKELFSIPLNDEIINELNEEDEENNNEEEDKYEIITPEIIKESIPIKRPYEDFLPIVTFRFDKLPTEIDYEELQKCFGKDFIIIGVERGSSIIKAAFVADVYNNDLSKCDLIKEKSAYILSQLKSTMGKNVVGNIVDEPTYTLPDNKKINVEYNKPYLNALQNTHELDKMDIDFMKKTAAELLINDCSKKNWSFIFEHEKLYEDLEKQILKDLSDNEFELIIVAQTVITNKNIDKFYQIDSKIKESNKKQVFLYHGTRLENHQKIVKNHFLMPGQDKIVKKTDSGFFGKGIYATEDIFYASFYANSCDFLSFNQKAHVICCLAVYNDSKVVELHDLSLCAQEMRDDIRSNFGIHHTLVGSSTKFTPIPKNTRNLNYISAEEFVFGNKFQIIPIYSFTVMRKDHYILWKDENLDTDENQEYLKELSLKTQVNVYNTKSVDQALDVIQKKKRNMFKMITNGGGRVETGRKLIIGARSIIKSDFVCLVFALDEIHMKWVKKMTNVLFTTSPADFKKFVNLRLDEDEVYNFAIELQNKHGYKFKLDKKQLLRFPTTYKSSYNG